MDLSSRRTAVVITALAVAVGMVVSAPDASASKPAGFVAGTVFAVGAERYIGAVAPDGTQSSVGNTSFLTNVAADGKGDVYYAGCDDSGTVTELRPGKVKRTITVDGLSCPNGMAVDASGDLFVADSENNDVLEVSADGSQSTLAFNGLESPSGVAVDAQGDVFVSSFDTNQVFELTPGGHQTSVGTGLDGPAGVAVDSRGVVFIANYEASTVVRVAPDGSQYTVGTHNDPDGIAVNPAGTLFVTERGDDTVVKVNPSGTQKTILSGFSEPWAVAVYVADQTISFTSTAPVHAKVGDRYAAAATGGASGKPVTFTASGACTTTKAGVTRFTRAGTCAVTANQAGTADYRAASAETQRITVSRRTQTVSFAAQKPMAIGAERALHATATSGAKVSFRSGTPKVCSVSGATVRAKNAGHCTVTARVAATAKYDSATRTRGFRVTGGHQA